MLAVKTNWLNRLIFILDGKINIERKMQTPTKNKTVLLFDNKLKYRVETNAFH